MDDSPDDGPKRLKASDDAVHQTLEKPTPSTENATRLNESKKVQTTDLEPSIAHFEEPTKSDPTDPPEEIADGREIIIVKDYDFVTMKNILYYLHTGRVNLHKKGHGTPREHPEGYPGPAEPFSLYRAANMYLLPDLEGRCYRYLISTCSAENICERLLENPILNCYNQLKSGYFHYLIQNFDAVKKTKSWAETGNNFEDRDPELLAYQSKLLFEISNRIAAKAGERHNSADSESCTTQFLCR